MKKSGRPSKYESNVKPRFAEILEWLKMGATDKEIAKNLDVNPKVFCKYKNEYSEFNELIKNGRKKAVQDIKAALFKRATGFNYSEQKIVESDKNGTTVETYYKYALPDPASAMILLKHWDKDEEGNPQWTQDPAQLQLKKEELELRKKHLESEDWTYDC